MKVEQDDKGFKPVSITIETPEELSALICCISGKDQIDLNKKAGQRKYPKPSDPYEICDILSGFMKGYLDNN